MRTGGSTALTVRGACLTAGLTFCLAVLSAELAVQVVVSDGALSIKAENQPIRTVLEELSWQTRLVVVSELALDHRVTIDIDQPTLPLAIRSLLRQQSYMLQQINHVSGTEDSAGKSYSRLWIFSDESDVGQQDWSTYANLWPDGHSESEMVDYQILAASDTSGDREEAMVGFGEIGDIGFLQQGLSDPDKGVRYEAIESLIETGGTQSIHALSMVLNDPDVGLRIDGVDAMGEIGGQEAIRYLRLAMTDENHTVREAAAEWLTELTWQRQ